MKTRKDKVVDGILSQVAREFSGYEAIVVQAILDAGIDPEDLDEEDVAAALVALDRALWPKSRGEALWRYTRNGSSKAERTCRICGRSVSWCSKWRRSVQSIRTESSDCDRHVERVLAVVRAKHKREEAHRGL